MQIPIKSKIPEIISGIVATVIVFATGWLFLSPFWFWVSFELFAEFLVAFGCCGEWWLHHHPAGRKKTEKDEHHRLESRFIAMVAVGVIMGLFALGHSIREGAILENKIEELRADNAKLFKIGEDAKTSASQAAVEAEMAKTERLAAEKEVEQFKAKNLELQAKVLELEAKMQQTEIAIAKNSPINQPVSDVFVIANFILKTNSFLYAGSMGMDMGTSVSLLEYKTPFTISLGSFGLLADTDALRSTDSDNSGSRSRLTVKFTPINISGPLQNGVVISNRSPLTVNDVTKRIRVMRFSSNLFPTNTEVAGDSAQLWVNGKDIGIFKIAPQKPQADASVPGQLIIWATNTAPIQ